MDEAVSKAARVIERAGGDRAAEAVTYILEKLDDHERAKFMRQVGLSLPQRIELVAAIITRRDCETCDGTGSAEGVVCRACLMNWHAPFAGRV